MADMPTLRTYLLKFPEVPHEGRNDIEDTFVDKLNDYSVITVVSWSYVGRKMSDGTNIYLWALADPGSDDALIHWLDLCGFPGVEIVRYTDDDAEDLLDNEVPTILQWGHVVSHMSARSVAAFHRGYVEGSSHVEQVWSRKNSPSGTFDATYYPERMMLEHNPDLYFRLRPKSAFHRG